MGWERGIGIFGVEKLCEGVGGETDDSVSFLEELVDDVGLEASVAGDAGVVLREEGGEGGGEVCHCCDVAAPGGWVFFSLCCDA